MSGQQDVDDKCARRLYLYVRFTRKEGLRSNGLFTRGSGGKRGSFEPCNWPPPQSIKVSISRPLVKVNILMGLDFCSPDEGPELEGKGRPREVCEESHPL